MDIVAIATKLFNSNGMVFSFMPVSYTHLVAKTILTG